MTGDGPVRLTLLAGHLGSGKTTWLRHQLRHGVFAGARVIVNEAADVPVDDALLAFAGPVVLAGGCACCDRLDAALALLAALPPGPAVFETSGLADPGRIVAAIRADPALAARVTVGEVVVAVDAAHGRALIAAEALARAQVAAADALIVTKTDLAADSDLRRLLATLAALNPRAPVFGAAKGVEVPLPDPGDTAPDPVSADDRPPAFAETLDLGPDADWAVFALWLSALLQARGEDVLRVKGVVAAPAGRLLVQAVQRAVQMPEVVPDGIGATGRVVVIGRGYPPGALARSLRAFTARAGGGGAQRHGVSDGMMTPTRNNDF